ncbi:glycosyltransferase [Pleurocapsa sp. PCC 7319]|uniref:glycosyltransferase n=1 Tax=Pleurocapsa sp. PCC 7319 TaxID=118161 RepID=UPI0003480BFA|nr:glycosyltransferase [Pleurocapsa sp. PCC 7319]
MTSDRLLPAIVVVAFKRPLALQRLLKTIARANYDTYEEIPLIISIDQGNCRETARVARDFVWKHGTKKVIEHQENLGLRRHIISCGDLAEEYGAVIILEDDLLVSPEFYCYTVEAIAFYHDRSEIGGISLYSYDFNEYAETKFIPLEDGYDNYFIQTASSWGQAWTWKQWSNFKQWYDAVPNTAAVDKIAPHKLTEWSENSWKKYFIKYLISQNKYFIYPRISLSTNSGDSGTNHGGGGNFQVSLLLGYKRYNFSNLQQSLSIYDSHYEIKASCLKKLNPKLIDIDFECDFYGTKTIKNVQSDHLLSIKECSHPLSQYALSLIPQELNIIFSLPGNCFSLGKIQDFQNIKFSHTVTQLKYLHKNLGWARYKNILKQAFIDLITRKINKLTTKKI